MKRSLVFLLALLCLFASSCGKRNVESATATPQPSADSTAATPQPYREGMKYHEVFDPDTDYDNRFYSVLRAFNMTETDDAYYFMWSPYSYLYYSDKASGTAGILCPRPECIHDAKADNTDCSGYIRGQMMSLSFYQGKLYYVGFSDDAKDAHRLGLFRMDPDGTNREKLTNLSCDDYSLIIQQAFVHRGRLYGVSTDQNVTGGAPGKGASVFSWDMETGEFKNIFKFNGYERSTIFPATFFFGNYLYFVIDGFDDDEGPHHVDIYRWDIEKEKLETLYLSKPGEFCNGWYRIWVETEDDVYISSFLLNEYENSVFRLHDGKLEKAFTIDFETEGFESADFFFLDGAVVLEHIRPAEPEKSGIQIRDLSGDILYDGKLSFDFIDGQIEKLTGLAGIYGTGSTMICPFEVEDPTAGNETFYIVKYDLNGGELTETLLFTGKIH